mmetsp:Transcript_7184/g.17471  ORF Transcript_7184/g.17471 Transcript_7184/m.17471 type:complete len:260 (-) Transcript_7184:1853-2632(-)
MPRSLLLYYFDQLQLPISLVRATHWSDDAPDFANPHRPQHIVLEGPQHIMLEAVQGRFAILEGRFIISQLLAASVGWKSVVKKRPSVPYSVARGRADTCAASHHLIEEPPKPNECSVVLESPNRTVQPFFERGDVHIGESDDVWPVVFPNGPPLAIDTDKEASLLIDVGGAALEETHSFIARWINHLGARTDLRQTSSPFDLHVADSADVQPARNRPAPAVHINLIAVRTVEVHRVAMQEANRPVRPGHRESRTRWSLP